MTQKTGRSVTLRLDQKSTEQLTALESAAGRTPTSICQELLTQAINRQYGLVAAGEYRPPPTTAERIDRLARLAEVENAVRTLERRISRSWLDRLFGTSEPMPPAPLPTPKPYSDSADSARPAHASPRNPPPKPGKEIAPQSAFSDRPITGGGRP
jgi:hypothetical protein